jgi:cation diffusion facilitator CzcD-associated flavoprotein CzcO
VTVLVVRGSDDHPHGPPLIEAEAGNWLAFYVINATGTWTNPVLPDYPGPAIFLDRQLHTRVDVVGGGISAVHQFEEISRIAKTFR